MNDGVSRGVHVPVQSVKTNKEKKLKNLVGKFLGSVREQTILHAVRRRVLHGGVQTARRALYLPGDSHDTAVGLPDSQLT